MIRRIVLVAIVSPARLLASVKLFSWLLLVLLSLSSKNLLLVVQGQQIAQMFTARQTQLIKVASDLAGEVYDDEPELSMESGAKIVQQYVSTTRPTLQAVLATYDGHCMVAFRGNLLEMPNLAFLLDTGTTEVCTGRRRGRRGGGGGGKRGRGRDCCNMRRSAVRTLEDMSFLDELESDLELCANRCEDCVVLTGHSMGATVATVAAALWQNLNPFVITFGELPSMDPSCDAINTQRFFRFVNTAGGLGTGDPDLKYDGFAVPFPPVDNLVSPGHLFLIPNDPTRLAYMGFNVDYSSVFVCFDGCVQMNPPGTNNNDNNNDIGNEGYRRRMDDLYAYALANTNLEIPTDGLQIGDSCILDQQCQSRRCDSVCLEPLRNCAPCDEDSDCAANIATGKKGRCEFRFFSSQCSFFPLFQSKCFDR